MTNNTNIFDMLQVMCDAAILIADGNWNANVEEYVRSRVPNCQHVDAFRDILHPVIERRKKATIVDEESTDRIDVAYKLFQERDKQGLGNMLGQIRIELQVVRRTIYDLSLNAKAAELLEKSEEYNKLQKELSDNHSTKQSFEKIEGLIIKLINLLG